MPEKDQKPEEGGFLIDFLTAFLITAVVGVLGFSGILAYSSMSYRNQIAQGQSAASAPALSGYAYAGPTGSHRPEGWPEPAAQAANYYIDRKNAPSMPSEETPEEAEAEQPVEAPEEPAAPAETPVLPDSDPEAPAANQTPAVQPSNSSTSGTEATGDGTNGTITIPNSESQQDNSSDKNSDENSSGPYYHDFSDGKLLGTIESNKYHCKDCMGAQKIPDKNAIWFDSEEDAQAKQYIRCGICYK